MDKADWFILGLGLGCALTYLGVWAGVAVVP